MTCKQCGGERRYQAYGDKPDKSYQQVDHTPEECIAHLKKSASDLLDVAYPAYCRVRPIDAVSVTAWNALIDAMDKLRRAFG